MRATAPKVGERVLVTDLTQPEITHEVLEVLAFDTDHSAWQVGVSVNNDHPCGVRVCYDTTLWVKKRGGGYGLTPPTPWALYNIRSELVKEAP